MSTRANVVIQDKYINLYFYRHSDGYPEETGESLKRFVEGYKSGKYRCNAMQSAGWLVLHGHEEYGREDRTWKVGAYEPTNDIHGDIDYKYVIDLDAMEIRCFDPVEPSTEMQPYSFKSNQNSND